LPNVVDNKHGNVAGTTRQIALTAAFNKT